MLKYATMQTSTSVFLFVYEGKYLKNTTHVAINENRIVSTGVIRVHIVLA